MGTCYSKSGDIDASLSDNRPREKKGSSRNGHLKAKNKPLLIVDQIQKDVSDTVYTEDSHTANALDIDNCINKSQQTSLDHLAKELYKNSEAIENSDTSTLKASCNNVFNAEHRNSDTRTSGADFDLSDEDEKPVVIVATDSGIVVENNTNLGSEHRQDKVDSEDAANDMYSENFEISVDNEQRSKTHSKTESHDKDNVTEKPFQPVKKVQSPRISSLRQSGEIKCANGHHSNISCNGECHNSLFPSNSLSHGTSEPRVMKSSLKKTGARARRKKGLSWKSSDSLDWVIDSMTTTLDRTKSVCSSVFGDDISLLNAPLAAFDSVDFAIGDSYDFSKHLGGRLWKPVAPVECCSDSMQFKCPFSGLEGESRQSISSLDRLSESHKSLDSTTTDLDKIKLVLRQASVSSTEQRYSSDPTDTSYELPCLNHQPEITTMTMNGREVVVIDAELFSQITDEIQFLKMKLSQLTEVIQESEAMEMPPRHGRSTPLSSVSSVS